MIDFLWFLFRVYVGAMGLILTGVAVIATLSLLETLFSELVDYIK